MYVVNNVFSYLLIGVVFGRLAGSNNTEFVNADMKGFKPEMVYQIFGNRFVKINVYPLFAMLNVIFIL